MTDAARIGLFYGRRTGRSLACATLALGLALPPASAFAAGEDVFVPAGETACAFGAWLGGKDGQPIPVRATPSDEAAILGTLPVAPSGDTIYEYPVQFDLVAARDGWVRIARAQDDYNRRDGMPARPVFSGEGWIPSRLARIGIQSGRGYAGPSKDSRLILDFPDQWITEVGRIERILGCKGEWILLEVTLEPPLGPNGPAISPEKREALLRKAWFRGVCAIMETTCDMDPVDADGPK